MAFHNVGDWWLEPGKSTGVAIARGTLIGDGSHWGGQDLGAQWIMADAKNLSETRLMVSEQTKHKKQIVHPGGPNPVAYVAKVTNVGREAARFSIQGGGNV
jgi:hypothetical protein